MVSWSLKRRVTYIATTLGLIAITLGWWLFVNTYEPPTCFDGVQNDLEAGIDCGGGCAFLCPYQVSNPVVLFSRTFEVTGGIYNAIAYVENPNTDIGNNNIPYTFTFYDSSNNVITERSGNTYISAGKITPVFEGNIDMGGLEPVRTIFELEDNKKWEVVKPNAAVPFIFKNVDLENASTLPRVRATIENTTVDEYEDVEVVTVVFDALKNAVATSRTFVDKLPRKGTEELVFTWPEAFDSRLEACVVPVDVVLLIDTSGSMNNDGDNPPQPLTDAKNAAIDFVERLGEIDRVGLATFATQSNILESFTSAHRNVQAKINTIEILPEEENGSTNMGAAISNASFIIENDTNKDNGREKVIILLTDGIANEPEDPGGEPFAIEHANAAKNAGYTIYTIGIGSEVNETFLADIASTQTDSAAPFTFNAATSKELGAIYSRISDSLCERGPAIIDIIPRLPDTPI